MKSLIAFALCFTSLFAQAAEEDRAYFEQFAYKKVQDTSDPDFPGPASWEFAADYGYKMRLNETEDLLISMSLLLQKDGTYRAIYEDRIQTRGEAAFKPRICKVINGTWSVPDKEIEFTHDGGTWGRGSRLFQQGQYFIHLELLPQLSVGEVIGQKLSVGRATSPQDPFTIPWCGFF